jgi:hypothetical protein
MPRVQTIDLELPLQALPTGLMATGFQPFPDDLDRVEAIARAAANHPLGAELIRMVSAVRSLVAAVQMLASELDGDE